MIAYTRENIERPLLYVITVSTCYCSPLLRFLLHHLRSSARRLALLHYVYGGPFLPPLTALLVGEAAKRSAGPTHTRLLSHASSRVVSPGCMLVGFPSSFSCVCPFVSFARRYHLYHACFWIARKHDSDDARRERQRL